MAAVEFDYLHPTIHLPPPSRELFYWQNAPDKEGEDRWPVIQDIHFASKFKDMLSECDRWIRKLYVHRPCARSLPPGCEDIVVEVMEPFVEDMKDLHLWVEDAISTILEAMKNVATQEARSMIIRLLGRLLDLDSVKNVKSSLKNDFSIYKRNKGSSDDNVKLIFFLAQSGSVVSSLHSAVKTSGMEDWIVQFVSLTCDAYEARDWCLPMEKFGIVKSLLIETLLVERRRLKGFHEKITRIFKECPYVPILNDIALNLHHHWEFPDAPIVFRAPTGYVDLNQRLRCASKSSAPHVFFQVVEKLSDWTAEVLSMYAFKLCNPAITSDGSASPYAAALKLNLNETEKIILQQFVYVIRELTSTLMNLAKPIENTFPEYTHQILVDFLSSCLKPAVDQVRKKRKEPDLAANLYTLNALLTETVDNPPSQSPQNILFIKMLCGLLLKQDSKGKFVPHEKLVPFLRQTNLFPYYWDFLHVIGECGRLDDLWFREYYMDLSKVIQVPVDHSLPTILLQDELAPFKIYDDAARSSLISFRQKFLFDEVESEANLALDQFAFNFAQKAFLRGRLQVLGNAQAVKMERLPLTFSLLGRAVPIRKITNQIFTYYLTTSIDIAITRFESSPFSAIVELHGLLQHHRATARVLHHPFSLSTRQIRRITDHALKEIITDLCQNWCWNASTKRFVKSCVVYATNRHAVRKASPLYLYGTRAADREAFARASIHRPYVGYEHFQILCEWVDIEPLIEDLAAVVLDTLLEKLIPILEQVQTHYPPQLRLPSMEIGTNGCLEFFMASLKGLIEATKKDALFSLCREIGNTIAILSLLNDCLKNAATKRDCFCFFDVQRTVRRPPKEESPVSKVLQGYIERCASEWLEDNRISEELSRTVDELSPTQWASTLVVNLMTGLHEVLRESIVPRPRADDWETSRDMYRVWSAVMFVFQLTPYSPDHGFSARLLFGDGIVLVGTLLLTCLEQANAYESFDLLRHILQVHSLETGKKANWANNNAPASPVMPTRLKLDETVYFVELEERWLLNWALD